MSASEVKTSSPSKLKMLWIILPLLFAAMVISTALYFEANSSPVPKSITNQMSFKPYYPASLPDGYSYDNNSVTFKDGILFFTISNGSKKISIVQQAKPTNPPDLIALTKPASLGSSPSGVTPPNIYANFHEIDSPAGQAVMGTNILGLPTAIILTDSSLINITSSSTLNSESVAKIVSSLKQL